MSAVGAIRRLRRGINETMPQSNERRVLVRTLLTLESLWLAKRTGDPQVRKSVRRTRFRSLMIREGDEAPRLDTMGKAVAFVQFVLSEEI